MRDKPRVWIAVLGLALLLATVHPASAYVYTPGNGWQLFQTVFDAPRWDFGTSGLLGGMSNEFAEPDNTPWTFSLPFGGRLQVTDVGDKGDRYRVWDNLTYLGSTSDVPWVPVLTPPPPNPADVAFADPTYSHGWVDLAPGNHSLLFSNRFFEGMNGVLPPEVPGEPSVIGWADAYFRVNPFSAPIPEPGSLALLGLGLAVAGIVIRRRR